MDRLAAVETSILVMEIGLFPATARDLNIDQPAISRSSAQGERRASLRPPGQDP
jgi:DNA-binding transcriptional LysR family regulator